MTRPVPSVGVVIPIFKQPALVTEAVADLLDQDLGRPPAIVLVNDGCPFAETHDVCTALATTYASVSYVRRVNGGLSAARNSGVDHLLARHDELEAVYFLDADNRLGPRSLALALRDLRDAPEDVGWLYPHIDMFGVARAHDYAGPYSPLLHRLTNLSEAGSLVRAKPLREGVRFDETMRLGYEDWSFFLSLLERGWRGRHCEALALRYRKRGESMLSASTRIEGELRNTVMRKHARAFRVQDMLRAEQKDHPRYAVYLSGTGTVELTTDPTQRGEVMSVPDFTQRFWAEVSAPRHVHAPPFIVATTAPALETLRELGLARQAFWRLERSLQVKPFAFMRFHDAQTDSLGWSKTDRGSIAGGGHRDSHLAMSSQNVLKGIVNDPSFGWCASATSDTPHFEFDMFDCCAPRSAWVGRGCDAVVQTMVAWIGAIRDSEWRAGAQVTASCRPAAAAAQSNAFWALRAAHGSGGAVVMPAVSAPQTRHIGFLLPLFRFGGVEKVATETARVFRERGWTPHLVIAASERIRLPESANGVFETVTFLDEPRLRGWEWEAPQFLGTSVPRLGEDPASHPDILAALSWLDALVNCHSAGGNAVFAGLRAKGVLTLAHEHVLDETPAGRPVGHPMLALAFEHAYDGIVTCSHALAHWFAAMGVPREKILPAPNAPGYAMAQSAVTQALERRRERSAAEPLRVLFLGRLDRQKGLDRLVRLVAASSAEPDLLSWRIIGDAVVAPFEKSLASATAIAIEPALYDTGSLSAAYAWADVLVLLSRWEGLPLTVLEAMRLGVTPIATDVGAIREVVTADVGYVLRNDDSAIDAAWSVLSTLARDRRTLRERSEAAALAVGTRSWRRSVDPIVDFVELRSKTRAQ
jgi:glycosyltransferase involved in cell wall biosynthesis